MFVWACFPWALAISFRRRNHLILVILFCGRLQSSRLLGIYRSPCVGVANEELTLTTESLARLQEGGIPSYKFVRSFWFSAFC